jgi:hypothetical protein
MPDVLHSILKKGVETCKSSDYVFPGTIEGRHLTERTVERIVRKAAKAAGIVKTVTCMTLRHSYAVDRLRVGDSIRDIQDSLGHCTVETTLQYHRYLAPDEVFGVVAADSLPSCDPLPASAFSLPFELPFEDGAAGISHFSTILRTHLRGRFLALKARRRPG